MDAILLTPRLKLTLITSAERGSKELEWLHELRSDEKATAWSIYGISKTLEDTEKYFEGAFPSGDENEENPHRVTYAVHRFLEPVGQGPPSADAPSEHIGLVMLKAVDEFNLQLPEDLGLPSSASTNTLTLELAYQYLPRAWGKGYAKESLDALFEGARRAREFWKPFEKVYVRAIVNDGNPASVRVMEKTEMQKKGIYVWTGEPVFLGGEWQSRSELHIYGMYLLE